MARKTDKKLQDRAYIAMILTLILGFGIGVFGMINTGLIHGEENRRKAESEQLSDTVVAARRGTIYDSNMNILAQSTDAWKIYVNPKEIPDEETAKRASSSLSSILDVDYDEVLTDCLNKKRSYIVLKSKVDFNTKQLIEPVHRHRRRRHPVLPLRQLRLHRHRVHRLERQRHVRSRIRLQHETHRPFRP